MRDEDLAPLRAGLRTRRIAAGLTQQELAERAGVSVRTVRGIEQGSVQHPRKASLLQLAGVLVHSPDTRQHGDDLRIGVLGPLLVHRGPLPISAGPLKLRTLLGLLALRPDRVVSQAEIVDVLWDGGPPATYRDLLHGYVSRLRKRIAPRIEVLAGSGYVLRVQQTQLDLLLFDDLLQQQRWEDALGCWRGPVLADLPDSVRSLPDAVAVSQRRIAATLTHADAAIAAGDGRRTIPWLRLLVPEQPLHEELHARLMLALAATGQQGEALAVHADIRTRLAAELGVQPGAALRQAHLRVLRQRVSGASRPRLPRQLPRAPQTFVGRVQQLAELDRARVSVICGPGGIGKTWLALRWAHLRSDRFPDGQLHVDLRGFDPTQAPVPSEVAVRTLLEALGVPAEDVPAGLPAQSALYRSLLSDKNVLLVLDNARDTAHVAPLLPGGAACTVLITSRQRMPGLLTAHGATAIVLEVFTSAEAHALTTRRLGGPRTSREPEAVAELVRRCAGLPLALSIVTARAAADPRRSLSSLAAELRDSAARLDALNAGELSADLRTAFAASYRALPEHAARMFRLLGTAPGPDISLTAAASLAGVPPDVAAHCLKVLHTVNLVDSGEHDRYRMHDLLRLYALELASARGEHDGRDRLVQFYLHSAIAANRLLSPHRPAPAVPAPPPGCRPREHTDATAATAWFDAEYACLLAAQKLDGPTSWQLARSLAVFQWRRGLVHDTVEVWRRGLHNAERLGDPLARVIAHRSLGDSCASISEFTAAEHHLHEAVLLARRLGDLTEEAHAHNSLAWQHDKQGRHERALVHATRALSLYRRLGRPEWEADMLNCVGWCHIGLGDHEQGRAHCEAALALCGLHGHTDGAAHAHKSLGHLAHRTGRHTDAVRHYTEALTLCRQLDHSYTEAGLLARLAEVHHARGRPEEAQRARRQAIALYHAQGRAASARRVQQQTSVEGAPT